jgi:hypothetical protein
MRPVCLTKSSVLISEIFVVVFKFLQICTTLITHTEMKDILIKHTSFLETLNELSLR